MEHDSQLWYLKSAGADDWSLSSDVSEDAVSPCSTTPGDENPWASERKLSSSCKSQTDSGSSAKSILKSCMKKKENLFEALFGARYLHNTV